MILVLGKTGMLGHMTYDVLKKSDPLHVRGTSRATFDVKPMSQYEFDGRLDMLAHLYGPEKLSHIVNCIGAIKPQFTESNFTNATFVNAVFPHMLQKYCARRGIRLIHITTDCVFDGADGLYTEDDPHNAIDAYGKSKSLGEPVDAMVLRTSIIGPEIGNRQRSFIEWVKSEDGKTVNGFTHHWWNGLTTLELAKCIDLVVQGGHWRPGIHHLFSTDVTKFTMVKAVAGAYGVNLNIIPRAKGMSVDRRLRTKSDLNGILKPQSFEVMMRELVDWRVGD